MAQKRICIRVDANEEIASGHFMRCLAIALELKKSGCEVVFITADNKIEKQIEENGFSYINLNTFWRDLESELDKIIPILKNRFDIMILDSYYVTPNYMKRIRENITLVYIDDIYKFEYPCDMLINYTNYYTKFRYSKIENRKLLLGTRYIPLREEFSILSDKQINNSIHKVLFLSGGADKYSFAQNFIERIVLKPIFSDIQFVVVCGSFNKSLNLLKQLEQKIENLYIIEQTTDIKNYMLYADTAVSAAGTTLYELCACGTPTISYVLADNQINNAESFQQENLIIYSGDIRKNMEKCLSNICFYLSEWKENEELRQSLAFRMKKKVDGLGSNRIVKNIYKSFF